MTVEEKIERILNARELRSKMLKARLNENNFALTFSLNVPGFNKRSKLKKDFIQKNFYEFFNYISSKYIIDDKTFFDDDAGYQYLVIFSHAADPYELKKKALNFEQLLGSSSSLIDIDIYLHFDQKISRENFAMLPRKCFLCDKPAKVCAFKQTHSMKELLGFTNKCLKTKFQFKLSKEYIFENIIEKIRNGTILPGTRITEEALVEEYQVSRTKIREVIFDLINKEVCEKRKNVGIVVKQFSDSYLVEIMDLRMHLKLIIFRDIFSKSNTAEYKIIIENILNNLKSLNLENENLLKIWNWKFYDILFSLSDKTFTKKRFEDLEILFSYVKFKIFQKSKQWFIKILHEHITICELLLKNDAIKLEATIMNYLQEMKESILEEYV